MLEQNLFELTNPQKSIWSLEQFYKNTSINNIGGTIIIKEKINFELLEKAINKFIELNDSFNIRLHFNDDGSIKQFFSNYVFQKIDLIDLNSYNDLLEKEKELIEYSFPLLNTPLYKFIMFKFSDETGGIIMIVHHLISDGFACNFAANKIAFIYNCLLNNQKFDTHFASYKDYILSEKNYTESTKFEKDKKYWDKIFETIPEVVSISTSTNKSNSQFEKITSSRELFTIQKDLLEKINNFCKSHKTSKYNLFMAIYSLYIGKVNDINDFVIGTPILNRTNFKEKNTTGMFINTIPFRCTLNSNITFDEYLNDISIKSINMLRHQKYSYEYILDELRNKQSNIPSLYNILLSYQIGKSNCTDTDFDYTVRWTHSSTNSDELSIHFFEYDDTDDTLNIAYDYQNRKFSRKDILDLHLRINHIINQVLKDSKIKISNIELVTTEEKEFIFNKYNSNFKIPINKTIIDMFEEQVIKDPYNIAISKNGYSINYSNFNNMINYAAKLLKNTGITQNDKVCLFFNNSIELVISIFAVLKLSACYIPIDISYPNDRIDYIINNSNSKFILTNSNNKNKLNNFLDKSIILDLEDIITECKNTIFNNIENKPKLDTLAYIIYTSGSTGTPKGVKIAHESLANYIRLVN